MRYSVETDMSPEEVVEEALSYFGEGGLGLDLESKNPCCVHLTGGGGHVSVTVEEGGDERSVVELETREWDYHVRKFMSEIG
jgi:hypothetical protein